MLGLCLIVSWTARYLPKPAINNIPSLCVYFDLYGNYLPSVCFDGTEYFLPWMVAGKIRAMWPDLAKNCFFCHILTAFGYFRNLHLLSGISVYLLWHIFYAFGKIFIDVTGQILKNNLAIWSHWSRAPDPQPNIMISYD